MTFTVGSKYKVFGLDDNHVPCRMRIWTAIEGPS